MEPEDIQREAIFQHRHVVAAGANTPVDLGVSFMTDKLLLTASFSASSASLGSTGTC
jgi:hypothetical protein